MQTRLRLFLDWGITFGKPYQTPDRGRRKVYYADRRELERAIEEKYPPPKKGAEPEKSRAALVDKPVGRQFSGDRPAPFHGERAEGTNVRS